MNPQKVKLEEVGQALEILEGMIARYDKKAVKNGKNPLDDDLKSASIEAMVPEEIDKHLTLNRSRLTDYASVRNEVVDLFEARTGKTVKQSLKSTMSSTNAQNQGGDPMDVDSFTRKGKGKGNG